VNPAHHSVLAYRTIRFWKSGSLHGLRQNKLKNEEFFEKSLGTPKAGTTDRIVTMQSIRVTPHGKNRSVAYYFLETGFFGGNP
jgi:hypothetical protein